MASPPPHPSSISSLIVEAETLTQNTGIIVMLIVSLELVLYIFTTWTDHHFFGFDISVESILTAILPLQTALVGYANKDAINQQQALMAISAVSILSLSHQSNWMVNVFSWTRFAQVLVSSASILVSASAVLFNTGFHGHYRRVPVYAFLIVVFVIEGMSALCVLIDLLTLRTSKRSKDDGDSDGAPEDGNEIGGAPPPIERLVKQLQNVVVSRDRKKDDEDITESTATPGPMKDNLTRLLVRNRDLFGVSDNIRVFQTLFAPLSGIVLLSLMAVAAADTHGFERIVLSFCSAAVFLRICIVVVLSMKQDEELPELCRGLWGFQSSDELKPESEAVKYFSNSLSPSPGQGTGSDLATLLKGWYIANKNTDGHLARQALSLAPNAIKVELATRLPNEFVLDGLVKKVKEAGLGSDRKLRWSKLELNLFLIWYTCLLELMRFEEEGVPAGDAIKGEEAV